MHSNYGQKLYEGSDHSHTTPKKRKLVYDDEDEQQKNCGRVKFNSSSSHRYKSIQSTSYDSTEVSRQWSYSTRDFSAFQERLVVVSYNVLGVENASKHPSMYINISPKFMDWDHRKTAIHKELAQYNPSILCFQEVDRFSDLHYILQKDGFKGVLKERTGDACDGCAIFWKKEWFVLLHEEHIEFQSFGLRNNVAQFCVLKTADACRRVVVGNIHVLYNPKRGDIKLGQMRLFLEKAHKLSQDWGGIPVILAGDLNIYPKSAVYQYISSGKLEILNHERRNLSGQIDMPLLWRTPPSSTKKSLGRSPLLHEWKDEELKLATGSEGVTCLQHNLELRSAYLGVPGNIRTRDDIGEPLGTICHSSSTGTPDYIWHSSGLVPFRVLETLPSKTLREIGGLPNEKWGSDHLALVCEFAFADDAVV